MKSLFNIKSWSQVRSDTTISVHVLMGGVIGGGGGGECPLLNRYVGGDANANVPQYIYSEIIMITFVLFIFYYWDLYMVVPASLLIIVTSYVGMSLWITRRHAGADIIICVGIQAEDLYNKMNNTSQVAITMGNNTSRLLSQ